MQDLNFHIKESGEKWGPTVVCVEKGTIYSGAKESDRPVEEELEGGRTVMLLPQSMRAEA